MSIFAKPVSAIESSDLDELLTENTVENIRLEFKSSEPSKDETLKKLSSFANTLGGYLIVGAMADSTDGRILGLPGVDEVPGYKQKLVSWCFEGASPPLTVEVSGAIPSLRAQGKVCYVVYVAESDVAPHFLNGRKGVWIRTDEFSSRFPPGLANDNELRHLLDRRQKIVDVRDRLLARAEERFQVHLRNAHATKAGEHTKTGPTLQISAVPRFPARELSRHAALMSAMRGVSDVEWCGGSPFPDITKARPSSQHQSAIFLDPSPNAGRPSILEVNVWGLVYHGIEFGCDPANPGIYLAEFAGRTLLSAKYAANTYKRIGYVGPIVLSVRLDGILGVRWLVRQMTFWMPRGGSELDGSVAFSIPTTAAELAYKPDDVLSTIFRYALFAVNLPDLAEAPEKLDEVVSLGYQYNNWQRPTATPSA